MLKPLAGFIALCLTQHVEPEIESETLESDLESQDSLGIVGDLAKSKLRTPGPGTTPGRGLVGTPKPGTQDSKKKVQKLFHPFILSTTF